MATGFEKFPELYGSKAWRALRLDVFLRDNYTCRMCGKVTSRPHADHIQEHKGNRELFFDEDNIQTLCPMCHDSRKRIQERHGYSAACDVNGIPIDPGHPWQRGKSKK